MLKDFYYDNQTLIKKFAFLVLFFISIYIFLTRLFGYVAPFVIGYLYSLIAEPLVSLLEKRFKVWRWISALLCVLLLIGSAVIIGTLIISRAASEIKGLQENLPGYIELYSENMNSISRSIEKFIEFIPDDFQSSFDISMNSMITELSLLVGSIAKDGSFALVTSLPMFATNLLLTLISSYFFIKDRHLIASSFVKYSPGWFSRRVDTLRREFLKAFVNYVKAQVVIMSVTMSAAILGLTIIRSPYSLLLGLLIGFVDALPIFGSGAILWPWAAYSLITGDLSFAVSLMIIYGVIFLMRQLLEPKVLGAQIGIHPLLVLLSVYVGMKLFGVIGIIAGPMIIITAKTMLDSTAGEA